MTTPIPGVPVIFEDDDLLIVDKPAGLLSQPGKTEPDSVVSRVLDACPEISGPALVHRLDMDTSGLLMLAKSRNAHRLMQQQFEHRNIGKRYRALLQQKTTGLGGRIHLPLRLDVDNRPTQIVCEEFGKTASTVWHKDPSMPDYGVVLYPLTGRSHQLRVHVADPAGLGNPIRGDRLYGNRPADKQNGRMMLHADLLVFDHPATGTRMSVRCAAPFLTPTE